MNRSQEVSVGGRPAGVLTWEDNQPAEFRLYPEYIDDPGRPVLGQIFEDDPTRIYRERKDTAPRWFGNLLPEAGSRLRQYLGRVGGLEPGDDLGFLDFLGQDLPGAVRIEARGVVPNAVATPPTSELELDETHPDKPPPGLRISLAGIQLKFSVVANGDRISLPAKSGEGNFILKVAGQQWDGLAANEVAMMHWAAKAGFDVAESRVVPLPDLGLPAEMFADAQHEAFLVRRFDRLEGRRVHQEDLAQVAHVAASRKYEGATFDSLAPLVRSLLGDGGFEEYLRRLALMVAQGNADAHLKNWSLRYADPQVATWSPLYDQVSTIAWPAVQAKPALKLAGVNHWHAVSADSLGQIAKRADFPLSRAIDAVFNVIERLRACWNDVLEIHQLPKSHRAALVEHWRRVRLLRDSGPLEA